MFVDVSLTQDVTLQINLGVCFLPSSCLYEMFHLTKHLDFLIKAVIYTVVLCALVYITARPTWNIWGQCCYQYWGFGKQI